jgi:addiction module HigA family antidote
VLPYIEPDQAGFASTLGIDPELLGAIVQEKAHINVDVALSLAKALGNDARFWLALQTDYDVWNAEQKFSAKILPVKRLPEDKHPH